MRFAGLDFGEKTIGVAVSDPEGKIALGIETVWRENPEALRASVNRLGEIFREYGIAEIILGYPKNMNNTLSKRCAATAEFKSKLERNFKHIPVMLWDERLSTAAVTKTYVGKNNSGRYEHHVDEMAAVYILQGYLDYKNKNAEGFMDEEQKNITMSDEEGNEVEFKVLSSKEKKNTTYLLAEEIIPDDADEEEEFADVLFFKCVNAEEEEMTFELVDDEHEDFETVLEIFKDEFEEFGIEMDDIEIEDMGE